MTGISPSNGKNPRILAISYDAYGGGATRAAIDLVSWMSGEGVPVTLCCLKKDGEFIGQMSCLPNTEFCLSAKGGKFKLLLVMIRLLQRARDYDVIWAINENSSLFISVIIGLIVRKPVVSWIHNHWSSQRLVCPKWHHFAMRMLLPGSRVIIAVSNSVATDLKMVIPKCESKIVVLPYPLDFERMERLASMAPPSPIPVAKQGQRTILSVCRLEHQKGIDLLIKALASPFLQNQSWRLVLVGSGTKKAELTALAAALNINQNIVWIDFTENPYPYFKTADLFVLPSRFEGLGIVLVEAINFKLPVVATNCPGGPSEVLEKYKMGVLVVPDDIKSLANAIQEKLKQPKNTELEADEILLRYSQKFAGPNFLRVMSAAMNTRGN